MSDKRKVFISYRHSDFAIADEIRKEFCAYPEQIQVFFDERSLREGRANSKDWDKTLRAELASSDALVAVITRDYFDGGYCKLEFDYAMEHRPPQDVFLMPARETGLANHPYGIAQSALTRGRWICENGKPSDGLISEAVKFVVDKLQSRSETPPLADSEPDDPNRPEPLGDHTWEDYQALRVERACALLDGSRGWCDAIRGVTSLESAVPEDLVRALDRQHLSDTIARIIQAYQMICKGEPSRRRELLRLPRRRELLRLLSCWAPLVHHESGLLFAALAQRSEGRWWIHAARDRLEFVEIDLAVLEGRTPSFRDTRDHRGARGRMLLKELSLPPETGYDRDGATVVAHLQQALQNELHVSKGGGDAYWWARVRGRLRGEARHKGGALRYVTIPPNGRRASADAVRHRIADKFGGTGIPLRIVWLEPAPLHAVADETDIGDEIAGVVSPR